MKKRHKTLLFMSIGVTIYGIAIVIGYSFLDGTISSKASQPETTATNMHAPTNNPIALTKWLTDIKPAAGGDK